MTSLREKSCRSHHPRLPVVYNRCSSVAAVVCSLVSDPKTRSPLALDEKIYELRREKLKQIEALGQQVYPRKYEFTHTLPQILAEHSEKTTEQLENPRINVRV